MHLPSGSQAKRQKKPGAKKPSLFERLDVPIKVIGGILGIIVAVFTISEKARNVALSWFGKEPPPIVNNPPTPQNDLTASSKAEAKSGPRQGSDLENHPEQYENVSLMRKKDRKQIAILVWQQSGTGVSEFTSMESKLAESVNKHGMEPVLSFFTPRFLRENHAQSFFAGDWTIANHLQMERHVDYVLIGFGKVSYGSNKELDDLLTANLEIELKCADVIRKTVNESTSIAAPGAGYSKSDALSTAIDHTQSQLDSFLNGIH